MSCTILIFTRFPVPGQVKTRLIPELGPETAARLHRRMAEHVLKNVRTVREECDRDDIGIMVCYSGARRRDFRTWLGRDIRYIRQSSGDIGHRMQTAFESAFQRGAKHVIAVGSDIPELSSGVFGKALLELQDHDIVLGPAKDGGYYLIGMKSPHTELFVDIGWGTGSVFDRTRAAIRNLGLTLKELPVLQDIDRPEDLPSLQNAARFNDVLQTKPELTVIIPTYNEEAVIGGTLKNLSRNAGVEIIVADGGSTDATREIAAEAGAAVLNVTGGRAQQQNAGAAHAKGSILFFLHADTLPPENYVDLIRNALHNPGTVAGAFQFRTDGSGMSMRLIERLTNIRSAVFQYPYGDQGLFMEKRVFNEEGGFSPLPIMEDFELVRRLRRRGRIVTIREPALTSARRWKRLGTIRTTLINQLMIAGFYCRIPMKHLKHFYRTAGMRTRKGI